MSESTIRLGLIGAGGNTRDRHIPGFAKQSNVEIVAVANRSVESGQKVADQFNIPNVASNWTEIIDDESIDAVCIGTWPYMHAPLTIAALEAGKHVLCEARMALNVDEAREMLLVSRLHPTQIAQIVPAPHTLKFDQTIMEMIGGGYIGDLITLDARVAPGSNFPNSDSPLHWRMNRDFSGNNIMGMGIWYEAMMRWIGQAATVSATGQSVVPYRLDESGHRVSMTISDHVDITSRMEQGGQMRFCFSSVLGHTANIAEVHIFGTEGTIYLQQNRAGEWSLSAGKRGEDGLSAVEIDPAKAGGWRVEEEFINAIRGKEEVTHTNFETGVKYMEWTDAVTMSLRQGEVVKLPLN
ncbi:MAG: Gfo/Idh/MocA family oxidoreductase [Alphaproteobacteria bacterium]|nr:Gfo/Idh/MocA family oxidoreductase [Alphaproteobacteria bacterium]